MFYRTAFNLAKFLIGYTLFELEDDDPKKEGTSKAWRDHNVLYKNYTLNRLNSNLYNVYKQSNTTKALWDLFNEKYKLKDVDLNKLKIVKFQDFKMVNTNLVMS